MPVQKSIELVSTFLDESRESQNNVKFETENRQNPLNTISSVCFLQTRLITEIFSRTGTIHPGIFRGRALWADGREVKHDLYGKRQTAKMKLLPSVFSSLYSRIKIFVFAVTVIYLRITRKE